MMYRFLTKIVVAYLVMLGDSTFAAECRYDNHNSNLSDSYLSKLALSDQPGPNFTDTLVTGEQQVKHSEPLPQIYSSLFATLTAIFPSRLNYTLFSPRAPPAAS